MTNVGQFAFSSPSPGKPSIKAARRFQTSEKEKITTSKKTSGRINVLRFDSGLKSTSLGSTSFRCVSVLLLVCRDVFLPADSLSLSLSLYLPPILLSLHLHLAFSLYVSFTSPHHTELPLSRSLFIRNADELEPHSGSPGF